MSNLAHRFYNGACACGSAWDYIAEDCSAIASITYANLVEDGFIDEFDYPEIGECRKGHAHCGRH